MPLLSHLRDRLKPHHPLPPGLHAYERRDESGGRVRLHLRVEPNRNGVLVINAARMLHLNQTAVEYTRLILDQIPEEQAVRTIRRRYHVDAATARADYRRLKEQIDALHEPATHFLAIPPTAFAPRYPVATDYVIEDTGELVVFDGIQDELSAPVFLPHGARIDALYAWVTDESLFDTPSRNLRIELDRLEYDGSGATDLFNLLSGFQPDPTRLTDNIPNDVVAVRGELPDSLQTAVNDAIADYLTTEEGEAILDEIYGWTDIRPAAEEDFAIVRAAADALGVTGD